MFESSYIILVVASTSRARDVFEQIIGFNICRKYPQAAQDNAEQPFQVYT